MNWRRCSRRSPIRGAGLISAERRGTWVYYRVNPQVMARMSAVLVPQPAAMAGKV